MTNQPDLFLVEPAHDPGGKVKLALPPGTEGDALFCGDNQEYRVWLSRVWGPTGRTRWPLFVGMNPSTAGKEIDDPTIFKEFKFARSWGYEGFWKANALDYRATYPRELEGVAHPRSDSNLPIMQALALKADKVVICTGVLPKPLQWAADEAIRMLVSLGVPLYCFGLTLMGHTMHPLYLKDDRPLVVF